MKSIDYASLAPQRFYNVPAPKRLELLHTKSPALLDVNSVQLGKDWCVVAPEELKAVSDLFTEELKLSKEPVGKKIFLSVSKMNEEAYTVDIDDTEIKVTGGSKAALRYALYTMMEMNRYLIFPKGRIEDEPLLNMRGFSLYIGALKHAKTDEILMLIRWIAEAKINTVLIEYGNKFPFRSHPNVSSPFVHTEEEIRLIVSTAESYGLEVIPMVQVLGHMGYILKDSSCEYIRELPDTIEQICPLHEDAMRFAADLIDNILEFHPNSKYILVGGDETRDLGKCPKCAEYVKKHGKGRLFTQFMNKVIDYVCSKGLTPLLADDMICTYPEAIEELDRRAIIVYWDYWATEPYLPFVVARYGNSPTFTYDKRWETEWTDEIEDVTRRVLEVWGKLFGPGVENVEESLGTEFMELYGKYLGDKFPKYVKAFPYLEYYQEKGFKVILMPTAMGNTDNYLGFTNQPRFLSNIKVCCERAAEAGATGVITSMWYPFPVSMYAGGICMAAHYSWGLPENATPLPDLNKKEY